MVGKAKALNLDGVRVDGERRQGFHWTISRKMVAVGFVSILALAILGSIGYVAGSRVAEATAVSRVRQQDLAIVEQMSREQLRLNLAAMDAIIDRDEGQVSPERRKIMASAADFLKTGTRKLAETADTQEEKSQAADMQNRVDQLEKAIAGDLVKAIESKAGEAEFARLDDVIDDSGTALEEALHRFEEFLRTKVEAADARTTDAAAFAKKGSAIALIASTLVLAIILFFMGRGIVRPITAMTGAMGDLAGGDLEIDIPAAGRRDEIGDMAAAVQVFKDNAVERVRLEAEQEEKERRAEEEKRQAMLKLADAFEASVGQVVEQVSSASAEMQSSSEAMGVTAEETTRQAAAVAAASEQASANVQTVASAAEELSSSIAEISRQVTHASQVARAAVEEAEETNSRVRGLAEAANKIGEVVALITDIAEQTNLLALNATIEAARAGDAGKGFAVVASEVKNLANQTAKATEEIGAQIAGIQAATQEAVAAIEGIGKTIAEIDEVASGIASAVEEQGAATQEIARNVEQAAAGTQEVSSNISGVSQAATETGSAAGGMRSAAKELSRQSELLRAEVDRFLATVREA